MTALLRPIRKAYNVPARHPARACRRLAAASLTRPAYHQAPALRIFAARHEFCVHDDATRAPSTGTIDAFLSALDDDATLQPDGTVVHKLFYTLDGEAAGKARHTHAPACASPPCAHRVPSS